MLLHCKLTQASHGHEFCMPVFFVLEFAGKKGNWDKFAVPGSQSTHQQNSRRNPWHWLLACATYGSQTIPTFENLWFVVASGTAPLSMRDLWLWVFWTANLNVRGNSWFSLLVGCMGRATPWCMPVCFGTAWAEETRLGGEEGWAWVSCPRVFACIGAEASRECALCKKWGGGAGWLQLVKRSWLQEKVRLFWINLKFKFACRCGYRVTAGSFGSNNLK